VQSVRSELRAGWKEARWSFYFLIGLFPCLLIAALLSYLIEGSVTRTPGASMGVLCVPATLVALFWAGLKDGLDGRLGRYVWTLTLLLIGYWIIVALIRTHQAEGQKQLRVGKHWLTVVATVEPVSHPGEPASPFRLPRANIHWEDMVAN
jgi:hypothetical protein